MEEYNFFKGYLKKSRSGDLRLGVSNYLPYRRSRRTAVTNYRPYFMPMAYDPITFEPITQISYRRRFLRFKPICNFFIDSFGREIEPTPQHVISFADFLLENCTIENTVYIIQVSTVNRTYDHTNIREMTWLELTSPAEIYGYIINTQTNRDDV